MKNVNYKKVRSTGFFVQLPSKSKLTLFFTIVTGLYLILYTSSSSYTFNFTQSLETITKNVLPQGSITENSKNEGDEKCVVKDSSEYNLRNLKYASSNEELEFLLNIRKLILFAVHELNKPLKDTDCVKWWANPLDLISHKQIMKSDNDTHQYHRIKFIIQPGNIIQLQVEIRQKHAPINVNDTELEIASSFDLFNVPTVIMGPCLVRGRAVTKILKTTCICSARPEVAELEAATEAAAKICRLMDTELPTWKPKDSFMIGDYMNFTDYEWFIKSPGNTTNEVLDRNFSSEYCDPMLKMLVMISSAPNHFKQRKIIRETFAGPENLKGKGFKVVFLMGIPTEANVNKEVLTEEEEHKDIIIANFQDSYHNLSLSHLSMYKWMQLTCGNGQTKEVALPKFLLKADDDFLLNLDLALRVAEANTDVEIIGCLFCGAPALRSTKYYTPRYMHISGSYGGYLNGVGYLLRTDVIPRFLHMSLTTPFIHMDDVYITGILTRRLKIYPRNSNLFKSIRIEPNACETKAYAISFTTNPDDMRDQWHQLVSPTPSTCDLRNLPLEVEALVESQKRKCFYE